MIKLLPFVLIPLLLLGGLAYWRLSAQQTLTTSETSAFQASEKTLVEVPKTLPASNFEDRIKALEDTVAKLTPSSNPNSSSSKTDNSGSFASRLAVLEATTTELKTRVSTLEKAITPVTVSKKSPLYIPLGADSGPWGDQDWNTLNEYQASINPDNYPGYSGMQLEANFRLVEAAGTGSVRLYNVTDKSSVSSEVSTTGTAFGLQTSSTFTLPAGQKTYTIQIKSSQGKGLFVQSVRVKVNF